jgi:homoserine kinase
MPETAKLIEVLRAAGHPAVVSGAGPSVLVLEDDPAKRSAAVELAAGNFESWLPLVLAVDFKGASVEVQSGTGNK